MSVPSLLRGGQKTQKLGQVTRQQLEQIGRPYEAIKVLEKLAKLEPEEDKHRAELEKAWQKLAHPIQAANYKKKVEPKKENEEEGKPKKDKPATPAAAADR